MVKPLIESLWSFCENNVNCYRLKMTSPTTHFTNLPDSQQNNQQQSPNHHQHNQTNFVDRFNSYCCPSYPINHFHQNHSSANCCNDSLQIATIKSRIWRSLSMVCCLIN